MKISNIVITSPGVGDIVFLNGNEIKFLALDSYDSEAFRAAFPSAVFVGVVASRQGNELLIVNKENETRTWSDIFRWKVSGWKLDGLEHSSTISLHSSMPVPTNPTFSYTGTTIDEVIPQFQAWLDTYSAQSGKSYRCYKCDDSTVTLICEPYSNWYEYIFNMTGLSVSYDVGIELGYSYSTWAKNGKGDLYKGMNWEKFYSYMHDTTSSTFNPTEPLKELPSNPISFKCYTSDVGKYVRDMYGEGEDGYIQYLKGYEIDFPSQRGILAPKFRSGHANTYLLESTNYISSDGTEKAMYPAFRYCADISYNHPLLSRGNWFLPSMYEMMKITPYLKMDYSDPVNRSLKAIGGKLLQWAAAWSSCRRNGTYAWFFNGWAGYSAYVNFCARYWCWPCLLLNVNEVNK